MAIGGTQANVWKKSGSRSPFKSCAVVIDVELRHASHADPIRSVAVQPNCLTLHCLVPNAKPGHAPQAIGAGGTVFGRGDMEQEDSLVGDGADGAAVDVLTPSALSAVGAGGFLGGVAAIGVKNLGPWRGVVGVGMG